MPTEPNNNLPPDLSRVESRQNRRIYQRERKLLPRTPTVGNLDDNVNAGIIQDGHAYAFDELLGQSRPSAPQLVLFSWPGLVVTGDISGPHLVVLPNVSRIYLITLAIAVTDPSDVTVEFFLNGTSFDSLTLSSSAQSTLARNTGSWPAVGGNATDILQVQCTAAGETGSDLVAGVRIV